MTGIFRRNVWDRLELEQVKQEDIDHWCAQCQFPYGEGRCQSRDLIQRCWNELQGIAYTLHVQSETHIWHLQHECPFVHQGLACQCNDFKSIEAAFGAAGLVYRHTGPS